MSADLECDDLVVGAGVVGLAIAAACARRGRSTVLIEQHSHFGQETSSRNSEVVHSGIYYPTDSFKTRFCIEGREALYEYCGRKGVPIKKTGKFVIATTNDETAYLDKLFAHASALDVPVDRVGGDTVRKQEPLVQCREALYFPQTGIVDSHQYMQALQNELESLGGMAGYRHQLKDVQRDNGFVATIESPDGPLALRAERLFNVAGLGAAALSNRILDTRRYEHRYCRGRYFALSGKYAGKFKSLVYPVPQKDGLGVHVTVDCEGQARLGPDVDWIEGCGYEGLQPHYECDWESVLPGFLAAARKYCPTLTEADLSPGLIGIRPKLFIDNKAHPDFLVEIHDGFVHCLGIESPGLTASPAIAHYAASLQA